MSPRLHGTAARPRLLRLRRARAAWGLLIISWLMPYSPGRLGAAPLTTTLVKSGLSRPIFVTYPPGDSTRLFIVQKGGTIKILNRTTGNLNSDFFLDIHTRVSGGSEQGLLGMAFHPDYASNGFFYIDYTDTNGDTVIARYTVSSNPDSADAGSAQQVLFVNQPANNHNGGWIGFGPDRYLYINFGDGGDQCDPRGNGQGITGELLANILRIDVDGDDFTDTGRNYAIPPTNPYVNRTGEDEIWSIGFRNPWRASFDRLTGDFYIADVGQDRIEEIDFQPASSSGGENYGWNCMEGNDCSSIDPSGCTARGCACNAAGLIKPIHQYDHGGSRCSVTGGYVYRGCRIPGLYGTYFFADYCAAQIWSLRYTGGQVLQLTERTSELRPTSGGISSIASFAEDPEGELYIVEMSGGELWKIVPRNDTPADIDADGAVDTDDAGILVGALLEQDLGDPALLCRSDINRDNRNDGADIAAWLAALGP